MPYAAVQEIHILHEHYSPEGVFSTLYIWDNLIVQFWTQSFYLKSFFMCCQHGHPLSNLLNYFLIFLLLYYLFIVLDENTRTHTYLLSPPVYMTVSSVRWHWVMVECTAKQTDTAGELHTITWFLKMLLCDFNYRLFERFLFNFLHCFMTPGFNKAPARFNRKWSWQSSQTFY